MSTQPLSDNINPAEELARFREEWKEEVRRKRAAAQVDPTRDTMPSLQSKPKGIVKEWTFEASPTAASPSSSQLGQTPRATDTTSAPLGPKLHRAIEVYRRAVVCEQQSNLDHALELYRIAFRMDSNVDRAYHKIEGQYHIAPSAPVAQQSAQATSDLKGASEDEISHSLKALDVHSALVPAKEGADAVPRGSLASIMAEWPHELEFAPEEERQPVHLQRLPVELLLVVLRKLDVTNLERFALVSRKGRALTLDMGIWREFVEAVYKPPQLRNDDELDSLMTSYLGDHRRFYIEQPRVRLDGVYIAICHYTYVHTLLSIERFQQACVSENAWINPVHMVQYHRFLRFYPDGQVISLLSLAEPREIIPVLKPTLLVKGLSIGRWRLSGTTVHIDSLIDPRPGCVSRHAFQMTLELRSRPLGRWNRLNFLAYNSVNVESGEVSPVPLRHDRGFHFSKVRSYA